MSVLKVWTTLSKTDLPHAAAGSSHANVMCAYCFAETDTAVSQQLQGLLSLVRDFKVENSRLVEVISEEKLMIAAGWYVC